jgi:DNA (cytosine-5)-methyltransferase 1
MCPYDRRVVITSIHTPGRLAIDLFAGCGGLSLGLHQAGWRGLFAVERDPMAFETLERNLLDASSPHCAYRDWPSWVPRRACDIDELLADPDFRAHLEQLQGQIGLVAGGPPCQGFSVGGARNGRDQRNQLVERWLDFVRLVRPTLALVENVEGIARRFVSKPGDVGTPVADYIVESLEELGYDAAYAVVDASGFGVPQIRRRVIVLGVASVVAQGRRIAEQFPAAMDTIRDRHLRELGLPTGRPVTTWEAMHDLDGDERVTCPDSPKFKAGIYGEATSTYARLMRNGIPTSELPNSHRMTHHGERILALYRTAHATQPSGRLSKTFLLSQGTKKDKKVLLDPSASSSTITTHPDEFIHYREPRNVTVREMARLQSFPDDFRFYGRYTINGPRRRFDVARCSQVGNAVPPLLARAVGLALHELLAAAEGPGLGQLVLDGTTPQEDQLAA